jgi:hypothetical protein
VNGSGQKFQALLLLLFNKRGNNNGKCFLQILLRVAERNKIKI